MHARAAGLRGAGMACRQWTTGAAQEPDCTLCTLGNIADRSDDTADHRGQAGEAGRGHSVTPQRKMEVNAAHPGVPGGD